MNNNITTAMDSPLTPEVIFRFCQGKGSAGASILMKDEICMYMYVLHQNIDTVAMTEYFIYGAGQN